MHQNKFKEAWGIYRIFLYKVTVYRFSFPFKEMKEEKILRNTYIFTVDFLFASFSCNYSLNMFHKLTVSDTGFGNILWLVYLKPFKVTFFPLHSQFIFKLPLL